jgi:hypothetical protein
MPREMREPGQDAEECNVGGRVGPLKKKKESGSTNTEIIRLIARKNGRKTGNAMGIMRAMYELIASTETSKPFLQGTGTVRKTIIEV